MVKLAALYLVIGVTFVPHKVKSLASQTALDLEVLEDGEPTQ